MTITASAFNLERIGDRFDFEVELAGSAGATLRYQKGPDRGVVTVTVGYAGPPSSASASNPSPAPQVTVIDCYNASQTEASSAITIGTVPPSVPTPRRFLFEITGKNASSAGYRCVARGMDY